MAAKAAVLVFETGDLNSCRAIVRQFLWEHSWANVIKVALSTHDLKPLGGRVWQVVDGNLEAASNIIVGFIMTQSHGSVTLSAHNDPAQMLTG
jgi:hypothetical protein